MGLLTFGELRPYSNQRPGARRGHARPRGIGASLADYFSDPDTMMQAWASVPGAPPVSAPSVPGSSFGPGTVTDLPAFLDTANMMIPTAGLAIPTVAAAVPLLSFLPFL